MIINDIDTEQVGGVAELFTAHPELARAVVHTRHDWEGGYALDGRGEGITVAGETLPRSHTICSDRPELFGGADRGPVPGELLLSALAACVGSQLVEIAAVRGIDLDSVAITCEGRLDLRGTLVGGAARPGLREIELVVDVATGADDATVDELLADAVRTSPVADTLTGSATLRPSVRTGATSR